MVTLTLCRCYEYLRPKWDIAVGLINENLVKVMDAKEP